MIALIKSGINESESIFISAISPEKAQEFSIGRNSSGVSPCLDFFYLQDRQSSEDVAELYRETLSENSTIPRDSEFDADVTRSKGTDEVFSFFAFWLKERGVRGVQKNYVGVILLSGSDTQRVFSGVIDLSTGYMDEFNPKSKISDGREFYAGEVNFKFLPSDYVRVQRGRVTISPHVSGFYAGNNVYIAVKNAIPSVRDLLITSEEVSLLRPRRVGDFDALTL